MIRYETLRTAEQIVRMGYAFDNLFNLAGEASFAQICNAEFSNITERHIRRYRAAYKFITANNLENLQNTSSNAIYTLMRVETPNEVIEIVKEKLSEGSEKIKDGEITEFIEEMKKAISNDSDYIDKLDLKDVTIADLTRNLKLLQKKSDRQEITIKDHIEIQQRYARSEERINAEISTMTDELKDMALQRDKANNAMIEQQKNPTIETVRVEVVPRQYADLDEAMTKKQAEIDEANNKLKLIKQQILENDINKKAIEDNFKAVKELYDTVDSISEKYTKSIMVAISENVDKDTKDNLLAISKKLDMFSKSIKDSLK